MPSHIGLCGIFDRTCYRGLIGVNSLLPWWKTRSLPDRIAVTAMQQIADWLKKLGMSEYAQLFADNSIDDVSILRDLTDQDLKDVGVPLGHRRKMLRAIAELFEPVRNSLHGGHHDPVGA